MHGESRKKRTNTKYYRKNKSIKTLTMKMNKENKINQKLNVYKNKINRHLASLIHKEREKVLHMLYYCKS